MELAYVLTAFLIAALIVRQAPRLTDRPSPVIRILTLAMFGCLAYAGASKGIDALGTGQIRLVSRAGSGALVQSTSPFFWIQLLMCWLALLLGITVSLIAVLAPREGSRG